MKKSIVILILSGIILLLLGVVGYFFTKQKVLTQQNVEQKTEISTQPNPYKDVEITTTIISSENNTFGYDIYVDSALLIHQPSKPGLAGNEGFSTKEQAQEVADLVVKKIRKNEMPPTVTTDELKEFINH